MKPKKDGTTYLAEVLFENGEQRWELIHWGRMNGFSSEAGEKAWLTQSGIGLKVKKIVSWCELQVAIDELECYGEIWTEDSFS